MLATRRQRIKPSRQPTKPERTAAAKRQDPLSATEAKGPDPFSASLAEAPRPLPPRGRFPPIITRVLPDSLRLPARISAEVVPPPAPRWHSPRAKAGPSAKFVAITTEGLIRLARAVASRRFPPSCREGSWLIFLGVCSSLWSGLVRGIPDDSLWEGNRATQIVNYAV